MRRYIIQDIRNKGDIFEEILGEGATEEFAREKLEENWNYLTKEEKKNSTMILIEADIDSIKYTELKNIRNIDEKKYYA